MVQKNMFTTRRKAFLQKKLKKKRNLPKKICLYDRKTLILWSEKLKL